MTHRFRNTLLFTIAAFFPFICASAHADWVLSVTGAADDQKVVTAIEQTSSAGTPLGTSAGHIYTYLGIWPGHVDPVNGVRYNAAYAVGSLYVLGSRKSVGDDCDISGDMEVRWTWEDEDDHSASDYIWDYSIKGMISADARVELEDNGGYGKAEAYAEVKLVAAGVNIPAAEETTGVSVGAEVKQNGESFNGIGIGIIAANISWQPGGQQLDASQTQTRTVTLSDIKRPGSACWIKSHTFAAGTLGKFHDTTKFENSFAANAYLLCGVSEYTLYKMSAPYYSPE